MKIGFLTQTGSPDLRTNPFDGPAVHVRQVILELKSLGHSVCLLAQWDGQILYSDDLEQFHHVRVPELDQGFRRLLERGIRRIQYQLELPYLAYFESLRFAYACQQVLADCDLLYERMGWMGYGGSMAAGWLNVPHILEVNGDHLPELERFGIAPRGIQKWLSVALMKRAISRSSHVIAAGEGWRQRTIERWQIEPSKVTTVHNGSEVVDLLKREDLRIFASENPPSAETTVVYIGSFQSWHGLPNLIRATAKVLDQGLPIKLHLVGSGDTSSDIQDLIQEFGIKDHVHFLGKLSIQQLAQELTKADIGTSPYCGWKEFTGLKLLDYKAAGLATIASGQDGQPAILEHGRTGWIVPPCDVDALAEAIRLLSCDGELRRKIGLEARMEAEHCHRWRHTAQQLEEIFEQLTQSKTRSNVKTHVNCNTAH
jgi:glycosyltransferase involved in cell wall biosynthesis